MRVGEVTHTEDEVGITIIQVAILVLRYSYWLEILPKKKAWQL